MDAKYKESNMKSFSSLCAFTHISVVFNSEDEQLGLMATFGDTLNQTFPGTSSAGDGELHRTFHTSSNNAKSTGLNFEQQFLFGKAQTRPRSHLPCLVTP
jgi:hypothetical protein